VIRVLTIKVFLLKFWRNFTDIIVSWAHFLLLFYEFYFSLVHVSPAGCTYELGKAEAGTPVLAGPKVAKLVPLAPLLICYNYCSIRVYKHFFSLGISTVAI